MRSLFLCSFILEGAIISTCAVKQWAWLLDAASRAASIEQNDSRFQYYPQQHCTRFSSRFKYVISSIMCTHEHIQSLFCLAFFQFVYYLGPYPSWLCSALNFLDCFSSGVLIWARHKHRPDVADQGCLDEREKKERKKEMLFKKTDVFSWLQRRLTQYSQRDSGCQRHLE